MNFPTNFLWGAATSAHQTEGNNVNSDWWALEHRPDSPCVEPSGDACDSYHRYSEDIAIAADLGLNSYRFGLEWARIEPAPGEFSLAELDHYRRMVDKTRAAGLEPFLTLQHFTIPQWFAKEGGWRQVDAADRFARYCNFVLPLLEGVEYVATINEPNIASCLSRLQTSGTMQTAGLPDPDIAVSDGLTAAHRAGRDVVKSVAGTKVGWTIATQSFQPVDGAEEETRQYAYERETRFLTAAADDDWIGVQAYTRTRVGTEGPLPIPDEAERTSNGWEYWPPAAASGIREVLRHAPGVPILVTENGIATEDDARRIDYVRDALDAIRGLIEEGIDIRGYFYWSLLDNFEWGSGYAPRFGLVSVDRRTFERGVKPSGRWFGEVAKTNSLR